MKKSAAKTTHKGLTKPKAKEKFTTFGWVSYVWNDEAKSVFQKFFSTLDNETEIPRQYFSSLSITKGGTNPIFKFLRLQSLQDIISSLRETISKGKRGDAKLLTTISILKDYLDCWDELFDHLDKFYGGADTANPARDKFERLRSAGKLFQVDASNLLDALVNENGNINFDVNEAEYTRSLEGFKDEFARLPQHPQNPTEKLSSIVSEAARSGAAKAHRSLRCAAARIAHEAIMKERDGEYDEAGFSAITHKRSKKRGRRKKLDGMPIIKVLLGKWDQEGSAYPTDYKFCKRYYYDTAFWKKQKWISDKGTRICFAPAKDDIGSRKAFLRFMMKFRRELALREKPTP